MSEIIGEKEEKIGYRDILKQKNYRKNMLAALINRFGDSVDSIALTWLVYQVTQSAAWSAIIFGVNRIPTIFLQPIAGAMIEGKNKKRIMILTDLIRGLCVACIATAMIMGFVNRYLILAMTVLISSAEAFRGPAATALLPKILDKKYYDHGLALNSSLCSIMELVGLGLASMIIAQFGISTAIYTDAITFFLSALIIATMRIQEEPQEKRKVEFSSYINDLKEGFGYVKQKKAIMYYVVLAVFLNAILVPFNSLQAPLISEILKTSEYMLSVLGITLSLGMICGSITYPMLSQKLSKRAIVCLGGYSIAIYYIILVLAGYVNEWVVGMYAITSLGSFLMGVLVSLMLTLVNVEFMKKVEESYLARVGALFNSVCVAAIPIVSFFITVLAKFLSTKVLFIITGGAGILVCIFLCTKKKTNQL
ncbi:MFS transporter [Anaerosporobacter faecicola]|uniref:MFS transporter n=1 Tax=Anaerosporobacter faecicola TaxID=2718714 RepID=UPI00143BD664|nr:MFS transporter [Anaerosporobacter faecicola]